MIWEAYPPVATVQTPSDECIHCGCKGFETNGTRTENLKNSPVEALGGYASTEGCCINFPQSTLQPAPEYNFPQMSTNQPPLLPTCVQSQWQPSIGTSGQNYVYMSLSNPSFPYIVFAPYYMGTGYQLSAVSSYINFIQPTCMYNPIPVVRTLGYPQQWGDTINAIPAAINMPPNNFVSMMPEQGNQNFCNQPSEETIAAAVSCPYGANQNENIWSADEYQTLPTWNFVSEGTTPCVANGNVWEETWDGQTPIYCEDPYSQTVYELLPSPTYEPLIPSEEFLKDHNAGKQASSNSNRVGQNDDDKERVISWVNNVNQSQIQFPPLPPKVLPLPLPSTTQPKINQNRAITPEVPTSGPVKANKKVKHCQLCKSNRELPAVYRSHILRDENGITQCPVLRSFVCPICKATGDAAHTVKYCPQNKEVPAVLEKSQEPNPMRNCCKDRICSCREPRYRTVRNSTGKYHSLKY